MSGYTCFAAYYDALTGNVDYPARAAYLLNLFERYSPRPPQLLLDLACGTGSMACEFARRGIEVIGADDSVEMLTVAREKAMEQGLEVLFLCQSMQELDLYGTVDSAVCTLDSLNHITDPREVKRALSRVSLFLEPGGIFLFDVNTPYKHEQVLGDHSFVYDLEDLYCVWQCGYDPATRTVDIDLDFFEEEEDGLYSRMSESFRERAYTREELTGWLHEAGLEVLDVFEEMTMREVREETQRAVYIVEKCR